MEYRIKWEIDLEADSPEQAARLAQAIQRDPKSTASIFEVVPMEKMIEPKLNEHEKTIDLDELDEEKAENYCNCEMCSSRN